VVEPTEFCGIEEDAGLAVADQGVLVPAVPKPLRDLQILVGDLVAQSVVGTFQPARPPLIRSSDPNCRATVNGSEYEVETVPATPIRLVTEARAVNRVIGSKRLRKWGVDFSLM
jgi:hypothetical protein